jgi:hypothetical protein
MSYLRITEFVSIAKVQKHACWMENILFGIVTTTLKEHGYVQSVMLVGITNENLQQEKMPIDI